MIRRLSRRMRAMAAAFAVIFGVAIAGQAAASLSRMSEDALASTIGSTIHSNQRCTHVIPGVQCNIGCLHEYYDGGQVQQAYYYMRCYNVGWSKACESATGYTCKDCMDACSEGLRLWEEAKGGCIGEADYVVTDYFCPESSSVRQDKAAHALAVIAVATVLTAAVERAAPSAAEMPSVAIGTVFSGMEARETHIRSELRSLKGLWTVESRAFSRSESPRPTSGTDAQAGAGASVRGLVTGVRAGQHPSARRASRVYLAFEDENYRSAWRILKPGVEAPLRVEGYLNGRAWLWEGSLRGAMRREVIDLPAVAYLGLRGILCPRRDGRLSSSLRLRQPELTGEDTVQGRRCYVITYAVPEGLPNDNDVATRIWVCPELGWAVIREEGTVGAPAARRAVTEYTRFREFDAGLWLPLGFRSLHEARGPTGAWSRTSEFAARATYLKVNVLLADEEFAASTGVPPRE